MIFFIAMRYIFFRNYCSMTENMTWGFTFQDMYRYHLFRPASREAVESSRHQTLKIHVCVTKARHILLDCQVCVLPLFFKICLCYLFYYWVFLKISWKPCSFITLIMFIVYGISNNSKVFCLIRTAWCTQSMVFFRQRTVQLFSRKLYVIRGPIKQMTVRNSLIILRYAIY